MPKGLDANAPQLLDLAVGIVQNVTSANYTVYYDTPRVPTWCPDVPNGTTANVYSKYKETNFVSIKTVDIAPGYEEDAPLYDGDVERPINLTGGQPNTTADSPQLLVPLPYRIPIRDNTGANVGEVAYNNVDRITLQAGFYTWVALSETIPSQWQPLRETTWSLDVNSDAREPQTAFAQGTHTTPVVTYTK